MLSLIEVQCPHCQARGQIMLPPLGSIIVGPCPECNKLVAIFSGKVLPLDQEIMQQQEVEAKKDHLRQILGNFVEDRVEKLFSRMEQQHDFDEEGFPESEEGMFTDADASELTDKRIDIFGNQPQGVISHEEVQTFVDIDLKLLDNKEYFKAVFE